jgi:hypothetical protein
MRIVSLWLLSVCVYLKLMPLLGQAENLSVNEDTVGKLTIALEALESNP